MHKVVCYLTIIILMFCTNLYAESCDNNNVTVGIGADLLYYSTGGYHGTAHFGYNHLRISAFYGSINYPGFLLAEDIKEQEGSGYGVQIGYSFSDSNRGIILAGGLEYWDGTLKHEEEQYAANTSYSVGVLSVGYIWNFYKLAFLYPNISVNYIIGGADPVYFGQNKYLAYELYPGASIIVGWRLF